ncbi:MAG: helix-turn-helix domain-containing protein [Candidatus Aminicenantes bacterium]|nr:helix-turn-helix domain-containing protein [Candidatus Aminicenantes bacterium]
MSYSKRKKDNRFSSFVAIPRQTLNSNEWKTLSPGGKILYIHLKSKYNARNNGEIRLYYSELNGIKGLSSPATISKAIKELETLGWIKRTKFGGLYRYMNEFRLTGKFDSCL